MRRRWILVGIGVLAGTLAVAVACSSGNNNSSNTPTATVEQMAATPTEASTAVPTEMGAATPTETGTAQTATVIVTDGALTDANGNTLYVFDNDTPGVSTCTDTCADNWPALTTDVAPTAGEGVTGTLATIDRADGTMQVTYNDQPLYYYAGDASPGDRNGDGIGGVWHVAMP